MLLWYLLIFLSFLITLSEIQIGEYPLFFAASTNQKDIFDHLLENGANMFLHDSNENNLLHLMVEQSLVEMYDYIEKRFNEVNKDGKEVPLTKRKNNEGQTPLIMAATLGLNQNHFSYL